MINKTHNSKKTSIQSKQNVLIAYCSFLQ